MLQQIIRENYRTGGIGDVGWTTLLIGTVCFADFSERSQNTDIIYLLFSISVKPIQEEDYSELQDEGGGTAVVQ